MLSSILALAAAIASPAGAPPQQAAPATTTRRRAEPPAGKVPLEVFAELPRLEGPQLSPDGRSMAVKAAVHGREVLAVEPLFGDAQPVLAGSDPAVDIDDWRWVGNGWLAIGVGSEQDVLGTDMYVTRVIGMSADMSKVNRIDWSSKGQSADVIWVAHDGSPHVLMSEQTSVFSDEGGFYPTVYDVDLSTGRTRAVTAGRTNVFQWFPDADGTLRMGYRFDDDSHLSELLYRADTRHGFDAIEKSTSVDDDLAIPEAVAPDGSAIVLDDSSGRAAVYQTKLPDLSLGKMIYGSPRYDVDDVVLDAAGTGIDGIAITEAAPRVIWLNPTFKTLQDLLDKRLGAGNSRIISWSQDRTHLLVHVGGPSQAGALYFWDTADGTLQFLGWYNETLKNATLSPVTTIDYKARDGLSIEAMLTLPRGREAKNLPLIVMPHGGPQARDDEEWDWWVQFLAEQGYAVVQPNYRGSTGYGKAFEDAGLGQWGLKMQDDLNDAVAYLVKQGVADPKRVCIAGASYGGYAAMRAAERDGAIYRCAISYAGVSDLVAMRAYDGEFLNGKTVGLWLRHQAPDFKAVSPRFDAASFSIPILIVAGKADHRVPVKQSRMMAAALKDAGKTYEYDEQPLADHFFSRAEDRLDFLKRMKAFLDKYDPA